jgi:hypothetical protein
MLNCETMSESAERILVSNSARINSTFSRSHTIFQYLQSRKISHFMAYEKYKTTEIKPKIFLLCECKLCVTKCETYGTSFSH